MTRMKEIVTRKTDLMWMFWLKFAFGFEVSHTSFGYFYVPLFRQDEGNESENV